MSLMNRFENLMEKYFLPVAIKLGEQRHLQAVKDGLILSLPLVIIGSVFLVLGFIPIPGYNEFMAGIFGDEWLTKLLYPVSVTFDVVSIIAAIGISYHLATKYKADALSATAISLVTFLLVTPGSVEISGTTTNAFALSYLGGKGLFVAIITSLTSTEIYSWFIRKNYVLKMPEACPPAVSKSFSALVPAGAIITSFWLVKVLLEGTSYGNIHYLVVRLISDPLTGFSATLFGGIVFVLINSVFWTFGIHGGSITGSIFSPIFTVIRDTNRLAFQNGESIPHIISGEFFDVFVFLGGSGATICLIIGYLIFTKSKQYREMGKLSLGPGIFNINEPVIFGSPVVLNPLLMIPFVLTPLILTIVSYLAVSSGLVSPTVLPVPWTMPILISGFLATGGHISGSLLQLFNLFLGIAIYMPFLKLLDKRVHLEESDTVLEPINESI